MLGTFQQSSLRIEIDASAQVLQDSLTRPERLQQWLWPQQFMPGMPEQLTTGLNFTSWLGPIAIQHRVETAERDRLIFLLSQGIDGFHEWYWGEGWVQSRIEGVTLLPINLGQTLSLLRLKQFVATAN